MAQLREGNSDAAADSQPNNPDLYEALGDEDQHISRFDDFVKQGTYFQLSRVYTRLNRKEDAQHALDELKKLKSQPAAPHESAQ